MLKYNKIQRGIPPPSGWRRCSKRQPRQPAPPAYTRSRRRWSCTCTTIKGRHRSARTSRSSDGTTDCSTVPVPTTWPGSYCNLCKVRTRLQEQPQSGRIWLAPSPCFSRFYCPRRRTRPASVLQWQYPRVPGPGSRIAPSVDRSRKTCQIRSQSCSSDDLLELPSATVSISVWSAFIGRIRLILEICERRWVG